MLLQYFKKFIEPGKEVYALLISFSNTYKRRFHRHIHLQIIGFKQLEKIMQYTNVYILTIWNKNSCPKQTSPSKQLINWRVISTNTHDYEMLLNMLRSLQYLYDSRRLLLIIIAAIHKAYRSRLFIAFIHPLA